jgi:hypothetical protein
VTEVFVHSELERVKEEVIKIYPGICLKGLKKTIEKRSGWPMHWLRFKLGIL